MIKLQKIFATGVDNKKLHIHKSFGQQIEAGREAAGLLIVSHNVPSLSVL